MPSKVNGGAESRYMTSSFTRLLWAPAMALVLAFPARAAENTVNIYLAKAKDFQAIQRERAAKGEMPRISEPRIAEMLSILSDRAGSFGSPAFSPSMEQISKGFCQIPAQLAEVYMNFNIKSELSKISKSDPKSRGDVLTRLYDRNRVAFQDEVTPLMAFSLRCLFSSLPRLSTELQVMYGAGSVPNMKTFLYPIQHHIRNSISLMIIKPLAETSLREENRKLFFTVIYQERKHWIDALPLEARASLKQEIRMQAPQVSAAYRDRIAVIEQALDDKKCEGLCKLSEGSVNSP
jgi:hypothetical protein